MNNATDTQDQGTATENTYKKFAPNVFIARCPQQHEKGATITLTTRYGTEHECIVFNSIGVKDGFFHYSIVRADGYNSQERAKAKAERLESWATSASTKADERFAASDLSESKSGIPFGQPILVGHHSERRHRRAIANATAAMDKNIELRDKAESHLSKAEYWKAQANKIDLSMPESLEYFEHLLEEAKAQHAGMKAGTIERAHSMSLSYANKKVKELTKKVKLAQRLWS